MHASWHEILYTVDITKYKLVDCTRYNFDGGLIYLIGVCQPADKSFTNVHSFSEQLLDLTQPIDVREHDKRTKFPHYHGFRTCGYSNKDQRGCRTRNMDFRCGEHVKGCVVVVGYQTRFDQILLKVAKFRHHLTESIPKFIFVLASISQGIRTVVFAQSFVK
jgi:hypothetical protein